MNQLLSNLIKIKSVNGDYPQLQSAIDVVKDSFQDFKGEIIEEFEKNEKPSVVIHNGEKGDRHFDVILSGHLDVVPGPAELFTPKEVDGKLFGRGASDMKGPDVAMIQAFREYVQTNGGKKIAVMLTTDEEKGGFDGTKYLVQKEGFTGKCVFLPDTGNSNWDVCTDEKGVLWLKVTSTGKAAHGSRPWLGENAIDKLVDFYTEYRETFYEVYGIAETEEDYRPTLNLGVLEGGETPNLIAEQALLRLDIRYPGEFVAHEFVELAEKIARKYQVAVETEIMGPANSTPADNEYVDKWCNAVEEVSGKRPKLYKSAGASDGRFFSAKGMPVVMCKPKCSDPHVDDEWIDLEDLERFKGAIVTWLNSI